MALTTNFPGETLLQGAAAAAAAQLPLQQQQQLTAATDILQQSPEHTPWGPVASVLLCLLPVAVLLLVTLVRCITLPSRTSLPLAAALLALIRLAYLGSPPLFVVASCLRGLLESSIPLSVIYGAILLFEAMQHTKCLPWMMGSVKSLSAGQPLAEVFLIGWAFAFMISGVGGFNTPIALGAPMLASLGHDPLTSLLVVLILNTLASHIGSVGMAIWFGFKTLGLGSSNILLIGLKSAVIVGACSFVIAPLAASFLVTWRQLLQSSLFVVLSIMSAVVPTALFSIFSSEFPVLIGGLASIIGTTLLVYFRIGLQPCDPAAAAAAAADTPPELLAAEAAYKKAAAAAAVAKGSRAHRACGCKAATGVPAVAANRGSKLAALPHSRLAAVGPEKCQVLPGPDNCQAEGSHSSRSQTHSSSDGAMDAATEVTDGSDASDLHLLVRPCPACLQQQQQQRDVHTSFVQSLATVSAPASYWHTGFASLPGDVAVHQRITRNMRNMRSEVATGCDDLWEDTDALFVSVLPASLVGATIHHAGISGVSPAAQRAGLLPANMPASLAIRFPRGPPALLCKGFKPELCKDIESGYEGPEGPDEGPDGQAGMQQGRGRFFLEVVSRTLPIWLTVLLLLVTRMPQLQVQAIFQSTQPSFHLQLGSLGTFSMSASLVVQLQQLLTLPGVSWKYELLYVPCLLPFVAASLVTMWVHRRDIQAEGLPWHTAFTHAWCKMNGTVPAFAGAMVLSELISAGGAASPAFIIGYHLSAWMGRGFLALAGFLGALGSFVSGSVMSGNMTFGAIQKVAAQAVGVPVTSLLAVQVAGACAGKMMCISNTLSAKVMMDLNQVGEDKIIRRTAPIALLLVLLSQALGLMFTLGGVWPDAAVAAQ